MSVFRKQTEEQQAASGLANLDAPISSLASSATLNEVLQTLLSINNSTTSGGATEATQLLIKACLDLIKIDTAALASKTKLLQVDTVGTTTYLGYAEPGTDVSVASWSIKRIIETGNDADIKWADGNNSFDNIWNDRLSLTYS